MAILETKQQSRKTCCNCKNLCKFVKPCKNWAAAKTAILEVIKKDGFENYQCGNCGSVLLGNDEFESCPICGFANLEGK